MGARVERTNQRREVQRENELLRIALMNQLRRGDEGRQAGRHAGTDDCRRLFLLYALVGASTQTDGQTDRWIRGPTCWGDTGASRLPSWSTCQNVGQSSVYSLRLLPCFPLRGCKVGDSKLVRATFFRTFMSEKKKDTFDEYGASERRPGGQWSNAPHQAAACPANRSAADSFAGRLVRETIYLARGYVCLFREFHHQLFVRSFVCPFVCSSVRSFVRMPEKPSLWCILVDVWMSHASGKRSPCSNFFPASKYIGTIAAIAAIVIFPVGRGRSSQRKERDESNDWFLLPESLHSERIEATCDLLRQVFRPSDLLPLVLETWDIDEGNIRRIRLRILMTRGDQCRQQMLAPHSWVCACSRWVHTW